MERALLARHWNNEGKKIASSIGTGTKNSNINFKRASCLEYFNTPNHLYGTRIIFKLPISLQILYYGSPRVLNLSCLFLLVCNHFPTNYLNVRHVNTFSHQHALRQDDSARKEGTSQ